MGNKCDCCPPKEEDQPPTNLRASLLESHELKSGKEPMITDSDRDTDIEEACAEEKAELNIGASEHIDQRSELIS